MGARSLSPNRLMSGVNDQTASLLPRGRIKCRGSHQLHLHLASDRALDDDLFANVAAHMWACNYGIGLFEVRVGTTGSTTT